MTRGELGITVTKTERMSDKRTDELCGGAGSFQPVPVVIAEIGISWTGVGL